MFFLVHIGLVAAFVVQIHADKRSCTFEEIKPFLTIGYHPFENSNLNATLLDKIIGIILSRMNCAERYKPKTRDHHSNLGKPNLPATYDEYLNHVKNFVKKVTRSDDVTKDKFFAMASTVLTVAINFEYFVSHVLPGQEYDSVADGMLELSSAHVLMMLNQHYIHHTNGYRMDRLSYTHRLQCLNIKSILMEIEKEVRTHSHSYDSHHVGYHNHGHNPPQYHGGQPLSHHVVPPPPHHGNQPLPQHGDTILPHHGDHLSLHGDPVPSTNLDVTPPPGHADNQPPTPKHLSSPNHVNRPHHQDQQPLSHQDPTLPSQNQESPPLSQQQGSTSLSYHTNSTNSFSHHRHSQHHGNKSHVHHQNQQPKEKGYESTVGLEPGELNQNHEVRHSDRHKEISIEKESTAFDTKLSGNTALPNSIPESGTVNFRGSKTQHGEQPPAAVSSNFISNGNTNAVHLGYDHEVHQGYLKSEGNINNPPHPHGNHNVNVISGHRKHNTTHSRHPEPTISSYPSTQKPVVHHHAHHHSERPRTQSVPSHHSSFYPESSSLPPQTSPHTEHSTEAQKPQQLHIQLQMDVQSKDQTIPLEHHSDYLDINGKRSSIRRLHTTQREHIQRSFATIAVAVIQGFKLQDHDLPCPVAFLHDIFDKYGEKNVIHIDGLNRLLEGKKSEFTHEHVHSVHKHEHHSKPGHAHGKEDKMNTTCEAKKRRVMDAYKHFVSVDSPALNPLPCLRKEDIRSMFQLRDAVTMATFLDMCPVILQQLVSGACVNETNITQQQTTVIEKYGLSTLCVFIISMCSFAGAVFVKCAHSLNRMYVMAGLLALSVGCLLGDAIIHLLPHILAPGHHGGHGEGDNLYKMCGALVSVYCFFLMELFFKHSHSHGKNVDMDIEISRDTQSCTSATSATSDIQLIDMTKNNLRTAKTENKNRLWQKVSTNSAEVQPKQDSGQRKSGSLKWMVLIGEMVHNFADGMAIGASFAESLTEGLSTSLAVFCHELPHELGDFAVLLSTGMSVKKALFLNFASSLTAFIGLYIGVSIGADDEARLWILSFGAGMFVYVALSTLMPELVNYFNCYANIKMFISLNFGLLLGFSLMLILAVFEDDIRLIL